MIALDLETLPNAAFKAAIAANHKAVTPEHLLRVMVTGPTAVPGVQRISADAALRPNAPADYLNTSRFLSNWRTRM